MEAEDGRKLAGTLTRNRLLDAAAEILAGSGDAGLTVRAVSRAADANVAAVKYHFGSREGLIAEVVARETRDVVDEQIEALDALSDDASPAAWVQAWARPLVKIAVGPGEHAKRLGRLIGQGHVVPRGDLDVAVRDAATAATDRLLEGLDKALPDVARPDLELRLALMASALAGLAGGAFEPFLEGDDLEHRILERLIALATA